MGYPERGAKIFGDGLAQLEVIGGIVHPTDQGELDHMIKFTREALGDERYSQLEAEGRQMSSNKAVAFVMDELEEK